MDCSDTLFIAEEYRFDGSSVGLEDIASAVLPDETARGREVERLSLKAKALETADETTAAPHPDRGT